MLEHIESTRRAMEQMEEANTIFEPGDKKPLVQLGDLLVWTVEITVICWLVFHFWPR